MLLQIDCDIENGGMSLNDEFLVDFADEPGGPVLAHEIRYSIEKLLAESLYSLMMLGMRKQVFFQF